MADISGDWLDSKIDALVRAVASVRFDAERGRRRLLADERIRGRHSRRWRGSLQEGRLWRGAVAGLVLVGAVALLAVPLIVIGKEHGPVSSHRIAKSAQGGNSNNYAGRVWRNGEMCPPRAKIFRLTPDRGSQSGVTVVTVTGRGLSAVRSVNIGNRSAPIIRRATNRVAVVPSPHAPGSVSVTVKLADNARCGTHTAHWQGQYHYVSHG